ncbi:MAG: hypothetical protein ACK4NV_07035 [Pannonibacter sp.]
MSNSEGPAPSTAVPRGALALFARAARQLRSGDGAGALCGFDRLLEDRPEHPGAALGRGLALHALGARLTALEAFRRITARDRLAWKAWGSIADITPDETERTGALAAGAEALVHLCAGANPDLLWSAAAALMDARRPSEAAALLSAARGPNALPTQLLARAYYHEGRFSDAFMEACRVLNETAECREAGAPPSPFNPTAARAALIEITDLLVGAGVTPFLASGTLLGFHRGGGPLAHDRDIDIGILRDPEGGPDIAGILRAHRALLLPRMARPGDRYFGLMHRAIAIDIFVYDACAGGLTCGFSDLAGDIQWRFSRFKLTHASYGDRHWTIPADPDRYLAETYGPGWQRPDTGFASVLSSPALYQTDSHARAYYAVVRARRARLTGDAAKAAALIHQSPVPIHGHAGPAGDLPATDPPVT